MRTRTTFACSWCRAEQVSLDLAPSEIDDARTAWLTEHQGCRDAEAAAMRCDDCGKVCPVKPVDHPRVIGLQTIAFEDVQDWLDDHDCDALKSDQLKAWLARCDEPNILEGLEEIIGPRPSWAPEEYDVIDIGTWSKYESEPAYVPMRHHAGRADGNQYVPARTEVVARRYADVAGGPAVHLAARSWFFSDQKWKISGGSTLTPAEARRLGETLIAAADLSESA